MLQTEWIATNEHYHRILAASDAATRQQLYLDLLVEPWQRMMGMMAGHTSGAKPDPLAGARMWAWLLPDQVEAMSELLTALEKADAWRTGAEALASAAARFDAYRGQIPFEAITGWLMLADAARQPAGKGLHRRNRLV